MARAPETADRLRTDIDRGLSGDKVPALDPAAAPLGTDDEAAGQPPTRAQVRRAASEELRPPPPRSSRRMEGFPTIYLVLVIPLSAAILLATYLGVIGRAQ